MYALYKYTYNVTLKSNTVNGKVLFSPFVEEIITKYFVDLYV
ncbi:hypothetical protein DeepPurple_gp004 [Bacillus phage Deep-Purple]|uniref:Uncharacterized protein n=1 Tax=Bacillus phage Deep-Purple TaxID=1873341 RepID=A0A1Z1LZL1_9CAUD|nr:hypothetical protein HWB22_gp05 [Bacillus phage Deep-Purple]ARW58255.1 hypothetical protein DeepPurple_gp004 [Bacillus phage Deep-Purple]